MFAQVIYGISMITSYCIYFKKKSGYALISTTSAAILNLGLDFLLIPQFGIAGATTLIGHVAIVFAQGSIAVKIAVTIICAVFTLVMFRKKLMETLASLKK